MKPLSIFSRLATLATITLSAQVFAATDAQFQSAFNDFISAKPGDSAAIEKAFDGLDKLNKAEPGNPVLMAYSGAAEAMKATTTSLPWKKMTYAEDGLAQIDKALALLQPAHDGTLVMGTPASLQTRFVAANTMLGLPDLFKRGPRGVKLLADVQASPLLAQTPLGFQGAVGMRAVKLAVKEQRLDDAKRIANDLIARHVPQAEQARVALKDIESGTAK